MPSRRRFLSMVYLEKTYVLPNKVKENWELFSATKQSLEHDNIIRSVRQTGLNIVSQWWIKI